MCCVYVMNAQDFTVYSAAAAWKEGDRWTLNEITLAWLTTDILLLS